MLSRLGGNPDDARTASRIKQCQSAIRTFPRPAPKSLDLSILILTKDRIDLLQRCLDSLSDTWVDASYEILIGDTGSTSALTTDFYRSVSHPVFYQGSYNFSRGNNDLARRAHGQYLLLLNDDTEAILPGVARIIQTFRQQRNEIGAIGAKLLYPDFRVQHAGIFICAVPPYRNVGEHVYKFCWNSDPKVNESRIVPAVTGACLFTPRDLYLDSGGLDEAYEEECQDVDYCFKLRQKHGLHAYFCAQSVWIHKEGSTRTAKENSADRELFIDRWRQLIEQEDLYTPE
jgi:GT2 family glycosyltransferase